MVTTPTQPGEPDRPPAGDADITLKKVTAGTTQGLDGAKFNIYRDGQIDGSYSTSATTDGAGRIFLASIPVGSYRVTEKNVPSNVILSEIPQEIYLEAGGQLTTPSRNHG